MVTVKGRSDSAIASLSQLGLAADPISVSLHFNHKDINVDAWGQAPADVQWMLATATVSMNLIHFDQAVLNACVALSMGGGQAAVGQLARAGQRLGNNLPRFAVGNSLIGLNIAGPVSGVPWRFFFAYLAEPPFTMPLGTEKSIIALNWRVIPFTTDPWGGGTGAQGYALFDHNADS